MVAAADTDNTIENNEITGNSNGIFLTSGVQGNTIRGNRIVGNPPVQIAVDHSSNTGFDIKSLADPGANIFEGNICNSSLNAPCPSVGPSLTADPNPIPVAAGALLGATSLSWNAPDAQIIEIHIGSPNGALLATYGNRGSIQTGLWVSDGLTFYLQDVTGGKPLTSDHTLAVLVVHLQHASALNLHPPGGPRPWAFGSLVLLGGLVLLRTRRRARIALAAVSAAALALSAAALGADKLHQMIASGASSKALAQYVFDTQGCKSCHTVGHDGKLGFTAKGQERARGFEGCIRMLTAMTVVVQVSEKNRSAQQRQKAERFEEFGCTACHRLAPGKLGLTEVGARLAHLHLGCVEVEKLVSSSSQH